MSDTKKDDKPMLLFNTEGTLVKKWSEMKDDEIKKFYEVKAQLLRGGIDNEIEEREEKDKELFGQLSALDERKFAFKFFLNTLYMTIAAGLFLNILISAALVTNPISLETGVVLLLLGIIAAALFIRGLQDMNSRLKSIEERLHGTAISYQMNNRALAKIKNPERVKREFQHRIIHETINLSMEMRMEKEKKIGRALNKDEIEEIDKNAKSVIEEKYKDVNPLAPFDFVK